MRIAIIASPWFNVPPTTHGGRELMVSILADELVNQGHDVLLYTVGSAKSKAQVRSLYDKPMSDHLYGQKHSISEAEHALYAYRDAIKEQVDVIHDNAGLMPGLLVGVSTRNKRSQTPILATFHGEVTSSRYEMLKFIMENERSLAVSSISYRQAQDMQGLPNIGTVYNAIDPSLYAMGTRRESYLAMIARMVPEKGCHLAIEVAKKTGTPLKLAGRVETTKEGQDYFHSMIKPHLGGNIEYIGEVDHQQKVELLSRASGFLFPIQWQEPFGLAAIESLACGTPVVAFANGALPEILRDGIDGYLVHTVDEMCEAVSKLDRLDSDHCRLRVKTAFSPQVMAEQYVNLYKKLIAESRY